MPSCLSAPKKVFSGSAMKSCDLGTYLFLKETCLFSKLLTLPTGKTNKQTGKDFLYLN